MEIKEATYVGSFPSHLKAPPPLKPEYAFIGRSNVGKSSLINTLLDRKSLARVSKKPGKTQSLNFYLIDKEWYIVDLPGYGYAKVSKKMRSKWEQMIQGYLLRRLTMQCAFVLIDSNVPPQKMDLDFINWLGKMFIPFALVFTKTDRLKPDELENNLNAFKKEMLKDWNELPTHFITSSNSGEGKKEILSFIDEVNKNFFLPE